VRQASDCRVSRNRLSFSLRNEPHHDQTRNGRERRYVLTGRQADAEKQEKRRRSPEACAVCDNGWWKCKCNPIALHRLYCLYWGAGSEAAANKQRERRVNGRSQAFNPAWKESMQQSRRCAIGFRTLSVHSLARSLVALSPCNGSGGGWTRANETGPHVKSEEEKYVQTDTHTHMDAHA